MPIVDNVWAMYDFLYPKIDYTNHHPVEAEDEERSDGYEGNQSTLEVVE